MGVTEEQVLDEDRIQEDFKLAEVVMQKVLKKFNLTSYKGDSSVLFTLCLIYVRQLKHHRYEEGV
jgi:hypothetical protein